MELSAGFAAGDIESDAVNVTRTIACEEDGGIGNFGEFAASAERSRLRRGVALAKIVDRNAARVSECFFVSESAETGCFHDAGRETDHSNVMFAELFRP